MSEEPRIHVGATQRLKQLDGSFTDITINLSGIPATASDELIAVMMGRAQVAADNIVAELGARLTTIRPVSLGALAASTPPTPTVGNLSALAPAPRQGEEGGAGALSTLAPNPPPIPATEEKERPIPKSEATADLWDTRISLPSRELFRETITMLDANGEHGGQIVAINAALSGAGFGGEKRKPAVVAILQKYAEFDSSYEPRKVLISTRHLSQAEAYIVIEFFRHDNPESFIALSSAVAALSHHPELPLGDPEPTTPKPADPEGYDASIDPFVSQPVEAAAPVVNVIQGEQDEVPSEPAIQLSGDQKNALDAALTAIRNKAGFVFVTGKAGTGKSTVLRELRATGQKLLVCAPTGLAAVNVGGQTIHSLFGLSTGVLTRGKTSAMRKPELLHAAAAIVLDEVSMVRADVMDAINFVCQKTMRNDLPFGGKPVIAFGDMFQIEPVVTEDVQAYFKAKYKSPFWFDGHTFAPEQGNFDGTEALPIQIHQLEQVFRQKGNPEFIDALNAIRIGDPSGISYINQRVRLQTPAGEDPVAITFTNNKAAAINAQRLQQLPSEEKVYEAQIEGEWKDSEYPTPATIALRIGAQVMVTRNIQGDDGFISNGAIGEVLEFTNDGPMVQLRDGREVVITATEWKKKAYAYDEKEDKLDEADAGSFTQIPVKLAWAITAHKSQGQTIGSACVLELESQSRTHGQAYVALSRVRSFDDLYLRRALRADDLVVNDRVREFHGVAAPLAPRVNLGALAA